MHPPPPQFTPVYAAPIHHQQHHTLVNSIQHSVSPQPFTSPLVIQQSQAKIPQLDSSLAVPTFQQVEDPIDCINKAMAFLSAVASRFPPSNNPLRTSSNHRYHATIQDGSSTSSRKTNSEEGHMEKQYTHPKRPRNYAWFKEKLLLVKEKEAGQILDEEQLAFIADPEVQEMPYSEQTHIVHFPDNEITSDSNIIPYSQYLQESQDAGIQNTNSSTPNNLLVLSLVEQMIDHVANLDKEN
ncbi:hypothetical protein Tco_0312027 [Tanacetum coccineum]